MLLFWCGGSSSSVNAAGAGLAGGVPGLGIFDVTGSAGGSERETKLDCWDARVQDYEMKF